MGAKRPDMFDVAAGDCQLMDFLLTRFDPLDLKSKVRVDPQGNMTELSSGPGGVKESAPVKVADVMLGAKIPEPAGEPAAANDSVSPVPSPAPAEPFVPLQPVTLPTTPPTTGVSASDVVQLGRTEVPPAGSAASYTPAGPAATPVAAQPDSATLSKEPAASAAPGAEETPAPAVPDLLDMIQNFHAERLRYLEEESKRDNPG